jgi:hypothetical protein
MLNYVAAWTYRRRDPSDRYANYLEPAFEGERFSHQEAGTPGQFGI